MRLTRRGWALVALVGFGLLMAWESGARSLNALVVPLVLALAAGVVTVARAGEPTVTRAPIEAGHVGDGRPVELEFDVGSSTPATVADAVGDGLSARGNVAETILTDDGYRYEVTLLERGEHEVGPVSVTVTDVLGLVRRRFTDDGRGRVLVYPRVYDLRGSASAELRALADGARGYERDEFDHLREYERGDSLRDVHWKSAARRPDDELMVKEFADQDAAGRVDLVAESAPGRADEMATAAASVAASLLAAGVPVRVAVPDGEREASDERSGRRALFELLATTGPGDRSERERREADVLIRSDGRGTVVRTEAGQVPFDRLRVDESASEDDRRPSDGARSAGGTPSGSGVVA